MSNFYPEPGAVLAGRYRVARIIGRGGMGVVLEAQNVVTQKRVALKWLHADLAGNPEAAERLVREATAAARISHPNVVDVYDVLQDGSTIFLVMDLLRGEPLAAPLERGGLSQTQLLGLLLPAMEGVVEAHRQGIVHRDLHPGNIFLALEGNDTRPVPKVLDFGISKMAGSDQRALTRSNISMGTPVYMSYEQLYSARDVDLRTDVYSLGVILYEGLTGQRPYDGESFMEVAGKITVGKPVHPKQLCPALSSSLAELVLRAMARSRDARIQTVEQLIAELEPFRTEHAACAASNARRQVHPAIVMDEELSDDDAQLPTTRPPPLPNTTSPVSSMPRRGAGSSAVDPHARAGRPLAMTASAHSASPGAGALRARALSLGALLCVVALGSALWFVRMRADKARGAD